MNDATLLDDTDSDNELPIGWEETIDDAGNVLFVNQGTASVQGWHPVSRLRKRAPKALPPGWDVTANAYGKKIFTNHALGKTSYMDPRLAFTYNLSSGRPRKHYKQKFDKFTTVEEVLLGRDLRGRHAIVTGASCGIGHKVATTLVSHGATVVCANRQQPTNAVPVLEHTSSPDQLLAKLLWIPCDFTSLDSVHNFAMAYASLRWPLHICVLSAGILPPTFQRTSKPTNGIFEKIKGLFARILNWLLLEEKSCFFRRRRQHLDLPIPTSPSSCMGCSIDGFEVTMQVNFVGQAFLLRCLSSVLGETASQSSPPPRVVVVSCEAHKAVDEMLLSVDALTSIPCTCLQRMKQYALSKFYQLVFAKELRLRLLTAQSAGFPGSTVNVYTCHPGNLITGTGLISQTLRRMHDGSFKGDPLLWLLSLFQFLIRPFNKTLAQGAATPVFCAVAEDIPVGTDDIPYSRHWANSYLTSLPYFNNCALNELILDRNGYLGKQLWHIINDVSTKRFGDKINWTCLLGTPSGDL